MTSPINQAKKFNKLQLFAIAGVLAMIGIGFVIATHASSGNPYLTACPTTPTLQVGSTGDCVKKVQWYLVNKGNYQQGHIDGTFDAITKQGVINLQAWVGLPATGVVEAKTWAVLASFEGVVPPPDPNAGKPGRIQGERVDTTGKLVTAGGSVTIDAISHTENPYTVANLKYGRHWVSAEAPAGWKVVGYSACINAINCHGTITPGTTAPVDVPANGYVDLWWHYQASTGAAATKPVVAPSWPTTTTTAIPKSDVTTLSVANGYTCVAANTSTLKSCTKTEYDQQQAFFKALTTCVHPDGTPYTCPVAEHNQQVKFFAAVVASTTCIRGDLSTYTCSFAEHDKQKAFFTALTTCIHPDRSPYPCTAAQHQQQAKDLAALAAYRPPAPIKPCGACGGGDGGPDTSSNPDAGDASNFRGLGTCVVYIRTPRGYDELDRSSPNMTAADCIKHFGSDIQNLGSVHVDHADWGNDAQNVGGLSVGGWQTIIRNS